MRINNNSSPSFGALKMKNMMGVLEPLKEGTLKAFNSQADSFSKFTDRHKIDVTFVKATADSPAKFFGSEAEASIEFAKELIERTASGITDKVGWILNPKAKDATNKLAAELMPGADAAARAAVNDKIEGAIDDIVMPTVHGIEKYASDVVKGEIERATDIITGGASDAASDVFTVLISSSAEGSSVSRTIPDMQFPLKKGLPFVARKSDRTMRGMFKMLRDSVKEVEQLNKINNKFGI